MIAEPFAHPPKDQLIAFGQGKLADAESSRVEQHLEVCRECCETLLDLKDDTFVGLVRIAKPQDQRGQDEQTDGHIADLSEHAATVLGAADETLQADELPTELWEHPRYRLVELIGQGGMGVVYRAEHRLMNRSVAIKLINAQLVRHPQAVERFRREVQAAAKLSHANIVTAHDAEQAGNAHFLVMEFVEGTDLASVIQQRGPMSLIAACDCIRQAAAGLQHAHERGMVHRDIKPHNLMISPDGQVRILDFGLANFATEIALIEAEAKASDTKTDFAQHLTTFGSVMGTPDYIAPEQARDAHTADIRADIYSLGCTLCYLLTGKPPFDAKTVIDKLKAHVDQAPPSLDQLRPDVPRELAAVVSRMMAKNPAEWFQTPAEVVVALAPFAQVVSQPPTRIGRLVAAASLFAAALLATVVIYVQTDKGALVIEAADEVAVQIDKLGVTIRDTETGREYRLKPGKHPIRSGQYQIDVTELPSGLELSTDKFRLTRGGEERVTVRLKTPQAPAPTPPAAVPMGVNLLLDASFEETAPTLLPRGWSSWLNDGPTFRCEVIADGRTGQRCLHITGEGTRAVVFANSVPVDHSKRYALKGWAKFDGDKDARAIIKFNYFHDGQWLGVHDLVGVTADQPGWHLLEKTDAADTYPAASTLVATCHVEGNGSAWFDDLELIAYDRDMLANNFEARHGRHNRLATPVALDRFVGRWETTYRFRATDDAPREDELQLESASEKTLDDHHLLSFAKATAGDEQRLLLLTFDPNFAAYRQWFFSSNGKAFESRGQWNDADQSLELRMLPDASRLTSVERFVDAGHTDATARQVFLMSIKDVGSWTSTRKSASAQVEVAPANGPAAESAELALLSQFVGDWTIRSTLQPSVWEPNGRTEIVTEQVAWILGGRFLMARSFAANDHLTTIWLATWEPLEKSYRFWFFSETGTSSHWRVTWDEVKRGFDWTVMEMPPRWIGTGFEHWTDADTCDKSFLIKDENSRVLLDGTQVRRRKSP
ncbi:MAG: serine/threonine-protein kinase [Planctomycetaceae bacterium]|nr:serine/threonine-protein kinase [Planctomycetaceae bacterium]